MSYYSQMRANVHIYTYARLAYALGGHGAGITWGN